MKLHRQQRVSKLIKEYLNELILRYSEFPGALATITEVEVSPNLKTAKVKISVLPTEKSADVLKILSKRAGELQYLLNRKLNIRPMPRIEFVLDFGLEKAARIEKQLMNE